MAGNSDLINTLLELADDHLILGHRLSEWCGHAPMLEEDLSLPNMGLDLLGQARNIYAYVSELEKGDRSEDDLAFLRTDRQYKNLLLVERPNGDFAHTMLRQFYFAVFMKSYWDWILNKSSDEQLQGFAGKAVKEISYHIRHCGEWVIRLGDGTEESAERMRNAVTDLHHYTGELFHNSDASKSVIKAGIVPDRTQFQDQWQETIQQVFKDAFLKIPEVKHFQTGGREGLHTEDFGFLLAELQYMQRTYPGQEW